MWIKNKNNINTPYEVLHKENDFKYINERTILLNEVVGTTSEGTNTLKKIFNDKIFSYPKPPSLITYLINLISNKNALVLDFFAGSGTTGQAVMELNQEDGGNRRFILVTNNENDIARKICYERLYRVINGIGSNGESFD
ncbi:MAG: DNA methyltransferase [Bacilli bacterium]